MRNTTHNHSAAAFAELPTVMDDATFLGAAVVRSARGATVEVDLGDGRDRPVRMALAFPYAPAEGDELLVIGREDACFVIGVLHAQNGVHLRFPGNLHLSAERELRLEADERIELTGKHLAIRVERMRIVADRVVESARELYQTVRDVWRVNAGRKEEVTTGEWVTRSERANLTTQETISINGKEVRLG